MMGCRSSNSTARLSGSVERGRTEAHTVNAIAVGLAPRAREVQTTLATRAAANVIRKRDSAGRGRAFDSLNTRGSFESRITTTSSGRLRKASNEPKLGIASSFSHSLNKDRLACKQEIYCRGQTSANGEAPNRADALASRLDQFRSSAPLICRLSPTACTFGALV